MFVTKPLKTVVPVDPLTERRRKPPLDHGQVGLSNEALSKLPRQIRGSRSRNGEHEGTGNRGIEPTDHAEKPARAGRLYNPKYARRMPWRICRRQTGGLDDREEMVIFEDQLQG